MRLRYRLLADGQPVRVRGDALSDAPLAWALTYKNPRRVHPRELSSDMGATAVMWESKIRRLVDSGCTVRITAETANRGVFIGFRDIVSKENLQRIAEEWDVDGPRPLKG